MRCLPALQMHRGLLHLQQMVTMQSLSMKSLDAAGAFLSWPMLTLSGCIIQVLIAKCLARRMCSKCGKNFNLADIDLPASPSEPAVKMPPLLPPSGCQAFLESRSDDNFATVKRRLAVSLLATPSCSQRCLLRSIASILFFS